MKKIVIINGHPNNDSFNFALADAYKKGALEFCGVKPVKVSYFGPVKSSDAATRKKWLEKAEKSGREQR